MNKRKRTLDALWASPVFLGREGIQRDDPNTWDNDIWPGNYKVGFLSNFSEMEMQEAWDNRQHPNVYTSFSNILEEKELWITFGHFGMMRPTKNIPIKEQEETIDRPQWKTNAYWLHWDQNPWKEPGFVRIQGILALTDCDEDTGGFHCVPGFVPHFKEWAQSCIDQMTDAQLVYIPLHDPMRKGVQKLTMKRGSLLIWDSRLPHGSFPNNNDKFRVVQYLTAIKAEENNEILKQKRLKTFFAREKIARAHINLTELGQKLLGLKSWK